MLDPVWRVIHKGQLGNKMFQYMIATAIARRVPGLKICGLDIPEWGIHDDTDRAHLCEQEFDRILRLTGHRFNIKTVATALQSRSVECVEYEGWACRVGYYSKPEYFRNLFPTPDGLQDVGFPDSKLLVNVRTASIAHPDYIPIPIALISHVIKKTNLTPVFMGQLSDDWYCRLLQDTFRGSEFIPSRGSIHDFETIRQTKNVLIPVSTFSWLACWLSEKCTSIHMPLLGMFNPLQRPDIDLAPLHDNRYIFYNFPIVRLRGEKEEKENLLLDKFTEIKSNSILYRKYLGYLLFGVQKIRRISLR